MKKRFLIPVLCVLAALLFAGCAKFPPYSYENPIIPDPNDWNTTEYDDTMKVDGVLDEAAWNTEKLSFLTGYVGEVSIDVRAYLGEMGVFIGVEVKDDYLYVNTSRAFFNNTSIELHLAPENQLMLSKDVAQLRYDVSGRKEQWFGIPSPDGYQYTFHYLPTAHAVTLTGEGAALNSEVAGQGWILETFVPYSVIGLSAKPNAVRIGPAYNHVMNNNADNSERQHADAPGMTYLDPGTFAIFDENGYNHGRSTVQEGHLFGHASDETAMSSGWDVSADTATTQENGKTSVVQQGAMEQYTYVKGYEGTKFYLEADLTFLKLMNANETHPKFGLISRSYGGATIYYVDAHNNQTHRGVGVNTRYAGGTFQWGEEWSAGSYFNYTNGKYVKLAILRDGAKYYYLLDDCIVHEETDVQGIGEDAAHVGFFTFNSSVEFKNVKFIDGATTEGSQAIDEIRAAAVVTADDMDVDGTFHASDWTGTQSVTITDKEATGKTVTIYSKLGTDGLYLAYDAYHAVYENEKSSWFENTNAEFFLNGTQEVSQRWISANAAVSNLGGGLGAMVTEEVDNTATAADDDKIFHTTVEAFIPYNKIPFYDEGDEYVRVGFAFKTLGDYMTVGHATASSGGVGYQDVADDWWYAAGHHPQDATNQYFIDEDGISPTLNISQSTLTAIDGDLSDWDTTAAYYTTNKIAVRDYDTSQTVTKNATMRAFINADGLFASWVVEHAILTTTAAEWFRNTNAELWINDMQFYVTANYVSLGGGQGAMKTVAPATQGGLYKTTVEAYVPMAILKEEFNYTTSLGYVRAGFAFKSEGDLIMKQGGFGELNPDSNGTTDKYSDWWFPVNHNPGYATEQYFVTADGIMETVADALAITLDGNASDWEALADYEKLAASKVSVYDTIETTLPSGFEVISFQRAEGVYVLMRATHKKDVLGVEWHQNTNAEIFVGSENLQVWVTKSAKSPKTYGAMTTTYSTEDGRFYSVAEFFIPVGAYVKNDDGTVSMRFCFKVDNGTESDKITVADVNDWSTDEYSENKAIRLTDAWWSMNIVSVGEDGIVA